MRTILSILFLILVALLVGSLGIGLLIFWSAGLGWLLIKVLPFTLFEGALLVLLTTMFVLYVAGQLLSEMPDSSLDSGSASKLFVRDEDAIPESRFWHDDDEISNEAWFRYQIANELYGDLSETDLDATLGKAQQKELAIRLTDIMVEMLKERRFRRGTHRVLITVPQMQAYMEKIGQRPYDADILETAVSTLNIRLTYDEDLRDTVLDNSWNDVN